MDARRYCKSARPDGRRARRLSQAYIFAGEPQARLDLATLAPRRLVFVFRRHINDTLTNLSNTKQALVTRSRPDLYPITDAHLKALLGL